MGWSSVCTARWLVFLSSGEALGDGPGHEDAVALEPEVPVQGPGVVLLDDEDRRRGLVTAATVAAAAARAGSGDGAGTGSGVIDGSRRCR